MSLPTFRVIGAGRAGLSLQRALVAAGWTALAVLHHTDDVAGAAADVDLLVLAVPDHAIATVAAAVKPVATAVVAHLAGAVGLDVLVPHARRAGLHPMVAMPDEVVGGARLAAGAWFAVAGDPLAGAVVEALGGHAIEVADADRARHHAAACMAANHTVAHLDAVARTAAGAGVPLAADLALVRAAVDDVEAVGAAAALTGPVSRGDWDTVARHLSAIDEADRPAYLALAAGAARLAGRVLPTDLDGTDLGRSKVQEVEVVDTKAAFRKALESARVAGRSVGLVPTMGALHAGHAALVRRAAAENDVVAVTLFVNPMQFDRAGDLAVYPRTFDADLALAADAGAAIVFAPSVEEVYGSSGASATTVHVQGLADRLEGASRPGHFDGVATVVTKLVSLAGPCRAYFGEKDFQQLAVVRTMVADLDLPAVIVGCATVRADDGLALSSRNALLTADEREVAPALHRALVIGAVLVRGGERDADRIRSAVVAELAREPRFTVDRVDVVDASTLAPPTPSTAEYRLLAAVHLGRARLIDNVGVPLTATATATLTAPPTTRHQESV